VLQILIRIEAPLTEMRNIAYELHRYLIPGLISCGGGSELHSCAGASPFDAQADIALEYLLAAAVEIERVVGHGKSTDLLGEIMGDTATELE
jgi:hypothetical protein